MEVNKYREQWNNTIEDNYGKLMPVTVYRLTWKNKTNQHFEFWSESEEVAVNKKREIDYSNEFEYVNFESWFAYRSDEHDERFGYSKRERGWWEVR